MRLVILGGGGFRVPLVYEAVATSAWGEAITEVVLHDTSQDRLAAIRRVIGERVAQLSRPEAAPALRVTTGLEDALRGAAFVFAAIRVGGAEARTIDERVALDLGLLGQETVGPGGLAYALRTIPVMRRIAETIARVAPEAWTINFTNPAGIVTQSMRPVLGERVVGICDTPIGLVRRVGRALGAEEFDYDYIGLNHLGWLRGVRVGGVERLPGLLADDALLDHIEEARLVGKDWVRTLGCLPNEYLYYYWHTDEAIAHIRAAGQTRGQYLAGQQRKFYEEVADPCCPSPLASWLGALKEREATYMAEARDEERRAEDAEGGGYQEVALRLMSAIATGQPERMILNVANGAAGPRIVPELPADVVVEVACTVDGAGVRPLPVAPVSLDQLGMMARLRSSEQAIAEAALSGDPDRAWEGFSTHPLVDSPVLGRKLLEGYRAANPLVDAVFS